jgi:adenylate cyclase
VVPDTDGLVRSVPGVAVLDGQAWPSLALAMALQAAGQPAVQPELQAAGAGRAPLLEALRVLPAGQAAQRLALDEHGQWRVPFQGRAGLGRQLPLPQRRRGAGRPPAGGQPARPAGAAGQLGARSGRSAGHPVNPALPGVEIHALMLAGLLVATWPSAPPGPPATKPGSSC